MLLADDLRIEIVDRTIVILPKGLALPVGPIRQINSFDGCLKCSGLYDGPAEFGRAIFVDHEIEESKLAGWARSEAGKIWKKPVAAGAFRPSSLWQPKVSVSAAKFQIFF